MTRPAPGLDIMAAPADLQVIRLAAMGLGIPAWALFAEIIATGVDVWLDILRVAIEGPKELRTL